MISTRPELIVPLLTPFGQDGEVDYDAITGHAARLDDDVDGFFIAGTTGEGPLLSAAEVVRSVVAVRAAAPDRTVVAQVGRVSTRETSALLVDAVNAGADAVAVITPYFYALTDNEMLGHFRTVLDAADGTPVYAYNIPRYTGNDLSTDVVRILVDDGLSGIKDSTRSKDRHSAYLDIGDGAEDFAVYMGSDSLALFAQEMGTRGLVPALANLRPELFAKLSAAVTAEDHERARALQEAITAERDALRGAGGFGQLKRAVAAMMATGGDTWPSSMRAPLADGLPMRTSSSQISP